MSFEHAHGFAGLHQQSFIYVQLFQTFHDGVEAAPVACSPSDASIDDQRFGMFGDFRVEVVHQHAQGCFGEPAARDELGSSGRADVAGRIQSRVIHNLFSLDSVCCQG